MAVTQKGLPTPNPASDDYRFSLAVWEAISILNGNLTASVRGRRAVLLDEFDPLMTSYINKKGIKGAISLISDDAYDATAWNGVVAVAPSKNAVRDKFVSMDSSIAAKEPAITAGATSQYIRGDKSLSTFATDARAATISDDAYDATAWNGVVTAAPSKNAVSDKFASSDADIATRLTAISPAVNTSEQGWRDNVSTIIVKGTDGNNPTWDIFRNGVYAYLFPGSGLLKEFWAAFHIDHDYLAGSAIFPHVHFASGNSTNTGNVKWFMEYTIAKGHKQGAGSVFATTTTVSATVAMSGTAYEHCVAEVSTGITDTKLEPDSIILIRFYRDPGDAGDTYPDTVYGFTSDLHYQFDRYGTKNKAPNFYT